MAVSSSVGPYIALALVSVASAATYPEEDDVVVLSPANFDSFISEHPISLVRRSPPFHSLPCKKLCLLVRKAPAFDPRMSRSNSTHPGVATARS